MRVKNARASRRAAAAHQDFSASSRPMMRSKMSVAQAAQAY
jgi:hypothetical protein